MQFCLPPCYPRAVAADNVEEANLNVAVLWSMCQLRPLWENKVMPPCPGFPGTWWSYQTREYLVNKSKVGSTWVKQHIVKGIACQLTGIFFVGSHLQAKKLATSTLWTPSAPSGLARLLPVLPLDVETHEAHWTPNQCINPSGSPRSTATIAALTCPRKPLWNIINHSRLTFVSCLH